MAASTSYTVHTKLSDSSISGDAFTRAACDGCTIVATENVITQGENEFTRTDEPNTDKPNDAILCVNISSDI